MVLVILAMNNNSHNNG